MQQKLAAAKDRSYVDYAIWGGLVPGKLHELIPLHEAGVVGFKAFMSSPGDPSEDAFREVDDYTLLEGMKIIAGVNKVLALHAESEPIVCEAWPGHAAEGRLTPADYVASRPVIAELEAINRALFYAEQTGCALHFVHISSEAGVQSDYAGARTRNECNGGNLSALFDLDGGGFGRQGSGCQMLAAAAGCMRSGRSFGASLRRVQSI